MLPLKIYLGNPRLLLSTIIIKLFNFIPDKLYLELLYFINTRNHLHLSNPQTYGEKIQWLKLYDHRLEYPMMVDKYEVKKYVATMIGENHIVPTLGVWEKPEDINFAELPRQFVLKTTHGGGSYGVIICKDKSNLDKKEAIQKLKRAMKQNVYKWGREWVYKNVKPRIIAEKYLEEIDGNLKDYKVFTFHGEPKILELDFNRFTRHQRNIYDFDWNIIDANIEYPSNPNSNFVKPKVLDSLYNFSKKLSKGIPHVRIDFYIVNNQIYFGEFTFYPDSGFGKIHPDSFDFQMGEWLILPSISAEDNII